LYCWLYKTSDTLYRELKSRSSGGMDYYQHCQSKLLAEGSSKATIDGNQTHNLPFARLTPYWLYHCHFLVCCSASVCCINFVYFKLAGVLSLLYRRAICLFSFFFLIFFIPNSNKFPDKLRTWFLERIYIFDIGLPIHPLSGGYIYM